MSTQCKKLVPVLTHPTNKLPLTRKMLLRCKKRAALPMSRHKMPKLQSLLLRLSTEALSSSIPFSSSLSIQASLSSIASTNFLFTVLSHLLLFNASLIRLTSILPSPP
ncbi:hypothetical protein CsSME_00013633 [Camellia sinensis var. sinensis]